MTTFNKTSSLNEATKEQANEINGQIQESTGTPVVNPAELTKEAAALFKRQLAQDIWDNFNPSITDWSGKKCMISEKNCPMPRESFFRLFQHLIAEITRKHCQGTTKYTREFLTEIGQENANEIIEWLEARGGSCDCEVLTNVAKWFI
jgi:hypothetical protein